MAKKFQFRLETLLRVRQMREREVRRKVGAKGAEIAQVDRAIADTRQQVAEMQQELVRAQQAPEVDPRQLAQGRTWIARLYATIGQYQAQRGNLVNELTKLQDELRAARTQTRIIEKLRERRQMAHRRDVQREEQTLADELAQQLHSFNRDVGPDGLPALKNRSASFGTG